MRRRRRRIHVNVMMRRRKHVNVVNHVQHLQVRQHRKISFGPYRRLVAPPRQTVHQHPLLVTQKRRLVDVALRPLRPRIPLPRPLLGDFPHLGVFFVRQGS
jgi:hypothetical protein